MGFRIDYRSTQPVSAEQAAAIRKAVSQANAGRTWLSCEPVHFFEGEEDGGGPLRGASKPNIVPHPDDAASAASEGFPDGTVSDLFDVLCQLSRDHGVDWEISHDEAPGPVGFIREGVCDPTLQGLSEAFVDLTAFFDELEDGGFLDDDGDEDDGEGPPILRLRGDS